VASQIFNLGKLRFTYKGAYSGSTEYQLNDVVKASNKLYVYINAAATTGTAVSNTSYWAVMIEGFIDPASGTAGQTLTTNGTDYVFSDLALVPDQDTHDGKILTTDGTDASWTDSLTDLELTGDIAGLGALFGGPEAKNDYETLGTNVKTISNKALTSNIATITTSTAHGFFPFQFVNVDLTIPDAAFDGEREIIDTPTPTTFTFESVSGNIASTAVTGSVSALPGYTNAVAVFGVDADDYSQIVFRNASSAAAASTDFIAYADNGTDFAGYIDMGITSSGFNDPEFTITGANDGYIFMSAPAGTTGSGNLVLATNDTGSENKIIFAAGGLGSDNTQMEITPDVNVHIEIPTPSTSSTTGALTVVGGVGVQGDMNIEGSVSIVGNLTFGGGSTTTENLTVTNPIVFVGDKNDADIVDLGLVGEYATTITPEVATVNNKALASNVATLTTASAHGFLVGDIVTITDVDATFNGTYQITGTPLSTTFTYAKTASNVPSTAVSPTGTATVNKRRKFAGVLRDASDGVIKFYKDGTTKPTTTANFGEAGAAYADIQVAGITANGLVSLSGTVDIQEMRETVVSTTISANAIAADWSAGNIFWVSSTPSANFTVNLTNVPTDNDRVMTINVFVTQGATGYLPNALSINGSGATIKWPTAAAPTPTSIAGRIDVFTFTLIRLSGAWTVLGSANLNWG
jgi:hypothetical protein